MLAIVLIAPALAEDVDQYIKDPKNENSTVRANAAWALGKINNTRAVDSLVAVLKDNDIDVRCNAAWSLGKIKDPKAANPLQSAVRNNSSCILNGPKVVSLTV